MVETPLEKRVDYDTLEFDDQLALLAGEPFTGLVVSHYPTGGLESLCRYAAGLPEGLQEEWYPNGQMFHRSIAVRGQGVSEVWTWYGNGQMRTRSRYANHWQV